MKSTIYTIRDGDILGGFAFNRYLNEIKATSVRSPSEFIVAQDHVEPGPEPMDLFHIENTTLGYNLEHYRVSGSLDRAKQYKAIFRHAKKSSALDKPGDATRRANILDNPNGQSNTLYLDGSVDGMHETTGENVRKSWYTGR